MRRTIGLSLLAGALALFAVTASAQKAADAKSDTFTFLQISEARVKADGSADALQRLVTAATRMSPPPAFIVDTGNVTDTGKPEEISRVKQELTPLEPANIKYYAVPGSRDIRWSATGRNGFAAAFGGGKTYQSFDQGGVHFVLLDSTVLLEHWGHLDKAELDWLERDLRRVKPDAPIMLFIHHEVGRESPGVRPLDNEYVLFPALQTRNVVAIFTGQNGQDIVWKTNNATTLMTKGLKGGSYHRISMTPLMATIERVDLNSGDAVKIASLPLPQRIKPSVLHSGWNDPNVPFLERRRPTAGLQPRALADVPDKEKGEYRINDGPWKPLTRDARDVWSDVFYTKTIPVGVHTATIRLTTSTDAVYQDELIFEVERDEREPLPRWAVNLDGAIQSSPLLVGDTVYVSALDGKVYALETKKGKRRWTFPVKNAQFVASPIVVNGLLYIGATDGVFYAIDTTNGKQKWKFETGNPIFATAAVTKGVVCVGGNGKIYGLDAVNGKPLWSQPTGGFFQSRAAADADTFYLGGWDNTLYALDATTGTPRWTAKLGLREGSASAYQFSFSPAVSSPAVSSSRVYIVSNDGVLHALNRQTGTPDWEIRAPSGGDPFGSSSPVVLGPTLFLAGQGLHGDVYALDTATGKELWRSPLGQPIYDSSPKLAPDGASLAILAVRGRVGVLSVTNGKRLWTYELGPGNIFSTPDYDGEAVYTATMANDVQALLTPTKK